MNALDSLIHLLSRLPGLGVKSASRIAYHLLKTDFDYNRKLGELVSGIKDIIKSCSVCGSYSEIDPCSICTDASRDRSIICVVEQPQDAITIDGTHEFNGYFHVLQGVLSPIDGIGPDSLTLDKLRKRVREGGVKELILAMNPTVEGDTTALYIVQMLKGSGIAITRLASGLPVGGDLEYAGKATLARSLKGRIPFSL